MALDDHTAQEHLTPDERRTRLRAFADRMLLKVTAMDDPEGMLGVERAMRTAAMIERIYSRCDRAERQAPDPNKIEADRARNVCDALRTRSEMIGTLNWAAGRRKAEGAKWDASEHHLRPKHPIPAPVRIPASIAKAKSVATAPATAPIQAETVAETSTPETALPGLPQTPSDIPEVTVTDCTDLIRRFRTEMGLPNVFEPKSKPDCEPAPP